MITVRADDVTAVLERAGAGQVTVTPIGATGGSALLLPGERPLPVKLLSAHFEGWFPAYMADAEPRA